MFVTVSGGFGGRSPKNSGEWGVGGWGGGQSPPNLGVPLM